jgi:acylphosphatase
MPRLTAYFSGHVQGVGFRFTTVQIARRFDVTGTVRNLPDGRVELIAEGESSTLQAFLEAIHEAMGGHIRDTLSEVTPGTGGYDAFGVGF